VTDDSRLTTADWLPRLERFYGHLPSPPSDAFAFYVWEVLSVHAMPARRDAAMTALRKIPALTPDAMAKAAPKKLEDAVTLAGPYREERLRALRAGIDAFRRNRSLGSDLRGPLHAASIAVASVPHLTAAGGERMLLFAGHHPIVPGDPAHARVVIRLGLGQASDESTRARAALDEFGAGLATDIDVIRRAAVYFVHHGWTTCTESDPHCTVCPLLEHCPEGQRRRN
jgi:endonuclease III